MNHLTRHRLLSLAVACMIVPGFSVSADSTKKSVQTKKAPAVAPIKKGNVQYSTALRERPCPPSSPEEAVVPTTLSSPIKTCGYSFQLVATAIDNGEPVWETTLYSRDYNLQKDRETQLIQPVSLKLQKGVSALVKNQKGDEFVVWLERGYLTKPATPKIYEAEK
jgi:hypothetical protein